MSCCQGGYLTTTCLSQWPDSLSLNSQKTMNLCCSEPGQLSQQVIPSTSLSHQLFSQDQLLQSWPESIHTQKVHLVIRAQTQRAPGPPEIKHSYLALEVPSAAQHLAPLPVFTVLVDPVVPLGVPAVLQSGSLQTAEVPQLCLWGFEDTFALPTIHV